MSFKYNLEEAMRTLTTDDEIDTYIREKFWEKCKQLDRWRRHHYVIIDTIIQQIRVTINHFGLKLITSDPIEDRWVERAEKLHQNAIIRQEDYDVIDGIGLLTRLGQYTYRDDRLIYEQWTTVDDKGCITTIMQRTKCTYGTANLVSDVEIREYEDWYSETIAMEHPQFQEHEVVNRTIYKRDLFREEYHTTPFRPVHDEMLFSPDVPTWYINEAKRAKEHYELLQQ